MKLKKSELEELYRLSKNNPDLTNRELGLKFGVGAYTAGCVIRLMSNKERQAAKLQAKRQKIHTHAC